MGKFSKVLMTVATGVLALWLAGFMFPIPRTTEAAGKCTGMGGWTSIGPAGSMWCHMN